MASQDWRIYGKEMSLGRRDVIYHIAGLKGVVSMEVQVHGAGKYGRISAIGQAMVDCLDIYADINWP